MKKKFIVTLFVMLLFCTGCATPMKSTSSNSSTSSSSEEISSEEGEEIADWITAHIKDFKVKYSGVSDFELAFADLGDDSVPDMMVRFKRTTDGHTYPDVSYMKYDNSFEKSYHAMVGDILDNEEPEHIYKLVERGGLIGALWKSDEKRDFNYYYEKGECIWFDINELSPDAFVRENKTSTISITDQIFHENEIYGCYSLVSNSQPLFASYAVSFIPAWEEKLFEKGEIKYHADKLVEECQEYYCEETGLYELYAAEKGIVEMLTGRTDYSPSCYSAGSFYLLPKDDYEKLYADYLAEFEEVEFRWLYRSNWQERGFTDEWLNQVAKEANESYQAYLKGK